ncbi:hypothetical protein [Chitinibacter sp. GC72]|uniref:hypothetical protein n=1 Tax=Chitinibacter sp. GC72 TaxID=1526917 RepID=UPI0012FB1EA8|nr:hypothetical protein [Chitinibacter sp. GC72]
MRKPTCFEFGVAASFLWIVFGVYLAFFSKVAHPPALDGWANVLAGFFSPIAFLWLVLGYRQQGEELRQNTEALRLQADELRLAVEQYQDMANTQREQFEHEKKLAAKAEEDLAKERRPKFELKEKPTAALGGQGLREFRCLLINHGGEVTDVQFNLPFEDCSVKPSKVHRISKGESAELTFCLRDRIPFMLEAHYRKPDGEGVARIQVTWNPFSAEELVPST